MRRVLTAATAVGALALASCSAGPAPAPSGLYGIATFEVAGYADETYRIGLASQELLDHAIALRDGEEVAAIPNGAIVRDGDGGVNAPWTWHIDPASLEFVDITTEVCDGLPSFVEKDEVTSPSFCPWSTTVTDVEVLR